MDSNLAFILKSDYHKARNNFDSKLDISCWYNANEFDNLNGLLYLNSTTKEEYKFKIIDEQKWFLAKIKYGF